MTDDPIEKAALGIVGLLSEYDRYGSVDRDWMVAYLSSALRNGCVRVGRVNGRPVSVAIFALVSEAVDHRIRGQIDAGHPVSILEPGEWRSGDAAWLLDVVGHDAAARDAIVADVRRRVSPTTLTLHPAALRSVNSLEVRHEAKQNDAAPQQPDQAAAGNVGRDLRIEGSRFRLERFPREAASLLRAWMIDPRVETGLLQPVRQIAEDEAAKWIRSFDGERSLLFAVRRRSDGRILGFYTVHLDLAQATATLSVVIGEGDVLRQHVAAETAVMLADWLFTRRGTEKIVALVAESNLASANWMKSLLVLEGTLRSEIRGLDGSRATVLRFGLLRDEWTSVKAIATSKLSRCESS